VPDAAEVADNKTKSFAGFAVIADFERVLYKNWTKTNAFETHAL
jgi:hypothetical protein